MYRQRLAVFLLVLSAIQVQNKKPEEDAKKDCKDLQGAVSNMNDKLLSRFQTDFFTTRKEILKSNKKEVYQNIEATRIKIQKILNDPNKTVAQKAKAALEAFDHMNESMNDSHSQLANASNGLVNDFHRTMKDNSKSMEKLFRF